MLAALLFTALALRISGAALRAHSLRLIAFGVAWIPSLLAAWLAATAFGIWAPLWPIAVLVIVATAVGYRYNSYLLWFFGDLIAILIYGLLSQLAVNLVTLIGVAMTVGIVGFVLDWLVAHRLTVRARLFAVGAPLIALALFAFFFSPTALESGLRHLQGRLFTMPSLATFSLREDAGVEEEISCTKMATHASESVALGEQEAEATSEGTPEVGARDQSATAVPEVTVGQWQTYEITLVSDRSYDNPFRDVEVYADFTSDDNRTIRVYGFYDGDGNGGQGNIWKIRFMAGDETTWSWRTVSSDANNSGLHDQSGQVSVVASDEPGPLAPDPRQPNAWQHANGEHFLWTLGYSIHMLGADRTHPGVGGWEDYLDWLEAHRFNGVMFILQVPSFSACSTCEKGVAPWSAIGDNPPPTYAVNGNDTVDYFVMPWAKKGNPNTFGPTRSETDFGRFYLPLWQKVDEVVSEMQQRGMVAHIFQYDDQTFWPAAGSSEEELYWDYMLRRLGAYWNVTFNDGIDLNEYRPRSWVPMWQQYFCEHDPFYHSRSSRHGDDDISSATWRSVQGANDSQPRRISAWRNLMTESPEKPVTEDDGIRARKGSGITPDRFMQLAWWSAMSGPGAFGATWAGAYDPGNWYSNLDEESEGMLRVEIRNRFVLDFDVGRGLSIPYWKLDVHDELVSEENVYVVAEPDKHYLVYFDEGAPRNVELDLSAAGTPLPVTWLNPATGERVNAGTVEPGGSKTFSRPYDGEAVLYIGAGEKDGLLSVTIPACTDVDDCAYLPMVSRD